MKIKIIFNNDHVETVELTQNVNDTGEALEIEGIVYPKTFLKQIVDADE